MSTFYSSLLTTVTLVTFSSTSVTRDTPILNSTKNVISKINLGYYLSADPNYAPITASALHPDNFNGNDDDVSESGAVSNPARYYLHGANFDKIKPPTCRLASCYGPYPNDGSLLISKEKGDSNEECEQIFVQMNGCVAHKGYPIGMVCTICCQCTKQFISEMSHSRDFLETDWLARGRFTFV
ncbi:unnamed protein product [Litomosoides sigmodontis]|uniref:Secreted protein n=1 Tax=Litomosoides sigmodontis TaxID=42156 RepID=A0A3P6SE65_LITSI|nr:unnamed protein product [Litomosoides sigmodontis]